MNQIVAKLISKDINRIKYGQIKTTNFIVDQKKKKNGIKMYSIRKGNNAKSVVAEKFIRRLKLKFIKT